PRRGPRCRGRGARAGLGTSGLDPPEAALRAGAVAAQVPETWGGVRVVDRRLVREAHARGLQVHVWTVNDPARMNSLLDLGVDGIMTDHLGTLRTVLTDRGAWV
ncbi:glycerophosphodiester phosphodiesterase family protein, partial [Streptomyces sp. Act-28]